MVIQQSPLRELALFAGAGGGILGGHLLGWKTICAVERDAYAASVLVTRQNDKILPIFPIWSDVTTFDGRPWRGCVDIISGGFPCQDISAAGKGAGIEGKRSGLWGEFARIISEVRPRYVFVENSPMLTSRGLGRVLGDLASLGYDARWCVLGADDCGAPHQRERIWILAEARQSNILSHSKHYWSGWGKQQQESNQEKASANTEWELANANLRGYIHQQSEIQPTEAKLDALCQFGTSCDDEVADTDSAHGKRGMQPSRIQSEYTNINGASWWEVEPELGRVVDELAYRLDRLRAIGNGQVSVVAATAFRILLGME